MMSPREILLVEDNVDDRDLFIAALQAAGITARLTWVNNAADAIMRLNRQGEFAGQTLPTLVVLDLGLPGLDGKALLQVIRTAYGADTLPVVVLTGSLQASDRMACDQWSIQDYVTKPVAYTEHLRLVEALLRWLPSEEPVLGDALASTIPSPYLHPLPIGEPPAALSPSVVAASGRPKPVARAEVPLRRDGSAPSFRLLVVEDNQDDYELLTTALRTGGLSCLVSWHADGQSAINALRSAPNHGLADLIITDLAMDGMDGHELLRQVRLDERLRQLPVVILTGSLAVSDRDQAAAADHYFIKPKTRLEWRVITALVWRYVACYVRRSVEATTSGPRIKDQHPLILHVAHHDGDHELFRTAFLRSGIAACLEQTTGIEVSHDFVRDLNPRVIIVDLSSGRSGLEFLALMRTSLEHRQIPIIIFSSAPVFTEVQTYRDLYVIDYVIKPDSLRQMAEFISALRQWFSSRLAQMHGRH